MRKKRNGSCRGGASRATTVGERDAGRVTTVGGLEEDLEAQTFKGMGLEEEEPEGASELVALETMEDHGLADREMDAASESAGGGAPESKVERSRGLLKTYIPLVIRWVKFDGLLRLERCMRAADGDGNGSSEDLERDMASLVARLKELEGEFFSLLIPEMLAAARRRGKRISEEACHDCLSRVIEAARLDPEKLLGHLREAVRGNPIEYMLTRGYWDFLSGITVDERRQKLLEACVGRSDRDRLGLKEEPDATTRVLSSPDLRALLFESMFEAGLVWIEEDPSEVRMRQVIVGLGVDLLGKREVDMEKVFKRSISQISRGLKDFRTVYYRHIRLDPAIIAALRERGEVG